MGRIRITFTDDGLPPLERLDTVPAVAETLPPPGGEGPLSIESYIRQFILQNQDRHTETELAAMLGMGRKALWMRRKRWGLFRAGAREAGAGMDTESA